MPAAAAPALLANGVESHDEPGTNDAAALSSRHRAQEDDPGTNDAAALSSD